MKNYFDTIYGNSDSIRYFSAAIDSGKLAHAYILEGPVGSGKRTLARAIAASRVKDSPFADKIPKELSPDLYCFGLADKKKTIGVDTVRELKSAVYVKPSELDAKFFILTDCQTMTVQAQNAALKILEEPPANVYFFLCTDSAASLLPTVRSRAQTVRMQIFTEDELSRYATALPRFTAMQKQSPEQFALIIKRAGGCIGRLNDTDENKDELRLQENTQKLIFLMDAGEYLPLLLFCSKLASTRTELDAVLLKTAQGLRDALSCRNGMRDGLQFYRTAEEALKAARHLTERALLSSVTEIEKIRSQLTCNPNLKGVQTLLADQLFRAMQN